jgi:FemAB-related protein (PEP-CTERM system-associated)
MTLLQTAVPRSTPAVVDVVRTDRVGAEWNAFLDRHGDAGFPLRSEWFDVLRQSLGQRTVFLSAVERGRVVGVLPLVLLDTRLFGRFLVSSPYLNTGGVLADTPAAEAALLDRATSLADELDVRYLEFRHERRVEHPRLNAENSEKVHMRLPLPTTAEALWDGFKSKLRSQVRKPLGDERLSVAWGREVLLDEFYRVFCRNMRDLGTPPYPESLFAGILERFPGAELCCVRLDGHAVAAALLVHGPGVTQVPSASSLREHNATAANMLMYWHLLRRAVERGQHTFDFGRSTVGSGTHRFKSQWGAVEHPSVWQYAVRRGDAKQMRPDGGRFGLAIRIWQRLPVCVTRWLGPRLIRGIP